MRSSAFLLILWAGATSAQVYSWTDAHGGEHYTNTSDDIPDGTRVKELLPPDPAPPPSAGPTSRPEDALLEGLEPPVAFRVARPVTIPSEDREKAILPGIRPGSRRA